jgi:sigma-B regulation protein RsbU (phosphoserine phosphatase)
MVLTETTFTASQVLDALHRDEPYLFLGAAFITVGLVSIAFCALRRRFYSLLVWMGVTALLYGLRMWLHSDLILFSAAPGELLTRSREAINYLVPIPAFIFFQVAGFLGRGKAAVVVPTGMFLGMVGATMALGPLPWIHATNNGVVISVMFAMVLTALRKRGSEHDFVVVRRGVICFAALALWDNMVSISGVPKLEPYGFAFLLGCLGYMSAGRLLERDLELGEIQKELELARRIQLSILPDAFPLSADFRVAARYLPMTSVAGDLYDFVVAGERQAGLLIADVSGHGVPAALIASMVKMAASSQRANAAHPAQLLAGMNAALCGNTQGQLVTAAYVHLDAVTRELRYAAAGHPAMLLLRDGDVTEIVENGLPLAASDKASYTEKALALKAGDRLLLYTDGLVEARNGLGVLFGEEALTNALRRSASLAPGEAVNQLMGAVEQWARSQDDDLTALICDFVGTE